MSAWIFKNRVVWMVGLVVGLIALDQFSKVWAQGALTEEREVVRPKEVADENGGTTRTEERTLEHVAVRTIPVFRTDLIAFSFKYAENRAAAFSLTQSISEGLRRPLLLLVSLGACVLIGVWYMRLKVADWLLLTAFPLIIAGALGNFLDRARLSYVIDFLDFYVTAPDASMWLRQPHTILGMQVRLSDHWPTFNVADMCIVGGAIGVLLRTLRPGAEVTEAKPSPSKPVAAAEKAA